LTHAVGELPSAAAVSSPRAASPPAADSSLPAVAASDIPEGAQAIRAPVVGTFYCAPEPGAKPFVEVGSWVDPDTTVGLIEVMKLFNTVKAGCRGRVEKLLVSNGDFVEFDQPLMVVRA
jgi:acetyl-CoA carboxylase biotin carboxyl carrier protein